MILWTGIRSVWLGVAVALVFVTSFNLLRTQKRGVALGRTMVFFTSAFVISFLLLPAKAQVSSLERFFPAITPHTENTSLRKTLGEIYENPYIAIPYQSRASIWPQALALFLENPWGLGIEYHGTSKGIVESGSPTKAHNIVLEALLSGGLGTLIIYLALASESLRSIIEARIKDREWMVLSGAILGIFIVALLQGGLYPTGWVILALILTKK